jgi:hypothetical protein
MTAASGFAAATCIKQMTREQKKYPKRQVDYWYGSCPPIFEYRSKKN